jgi:hypothetical protein
LISFYWTTAINLLTVEAHFLVFEGDYFIALHQFSVQGERLSWAIERNKLITLNGFLMRF